MSKKITKEEFLHRFYENYPNADISVIEYTAISKPCTVRCNKCLKILSKPVAREILKEYECCGVKQNKKVFNNLISSIETKEMQEQIDKVFENIELLEFVGEQKQNKYRCKRCGLIFKKKQDRLLKSCGCPKCKK